jgi:hypothetical protein
MKINKLSSRFSWLISSIGVIWILCLVCCTSKHDHAEYSHKDIANVMGAVTEVMVHDVTNPPLASRFFSYISLAGIEALSPVYSEGDYIFSALEDYKRPSIEVQNNQVDFRLGAVLAMIHTAKSLQPSGEKLVRYLDEIKENAIAQGISSKIWSSTTAYGEAIAHHVIDYSKTDGYRLISSYPIYESRIDEGSWFPTPPGYFPAVEPYFNTLRPFFLDSANQFMPDLPAKYAEEVESIFFHLAAEVYEQDLTPEEQLIAAFWDCNPFALDENGHLLIGLKKISPGAHWIGIANIACKEKGLSFEKTMEVNTIMSMAIHDAFIACWDEKYRSNRIRPETAIRKLIDPTYRPFLQTPPFPEYLSGHSVVSTASAEILTSFFGEHFSYVDTVEVTYGLEPRKFISFKQAAEEASISRLYGGIHYRDGIVEGQAQGKKLGAFVIEKLDLNQKF